VVNRRPGWRRHLPALLYLLALAALILALARPQATVLAPKEQATVMLVMDVSGSMTPPASCNANAPPPEDAR